MSDCPTPSFPYLAQFFGRLYSVESGMLPHPIPSDPSPATDTLEDANRSATTEGDTDEACAACGVSHPD